MDDMTINEVRAARILVAISFHFVSDRLVYLAEVVRSLASLPVDSIEIIVVTNSSVDHEISAIRSLLSSAGVASKIMVANKLNNPFYLTWVHKTLISDWSSTQDTKTSHFIYLEDDERLNLENILYTFKARRDLKPYGLLPGFVRTEWRAATAQFVNVDNIAPVDVSIRCHVDIDGDMYINLDSPYCGCYILDRELADEYVTSKSFDIFESRKVMSWEVRERAAAGLTWERVPKGFHSRTVIPVTNRNIVNPKCWLDHLPNTYSNNRATKFGKVPMQQLLSGKFQDRMRRNVL